MSRFADFVKIWLGQVVSLLGSGLTAFALGVFVYQQTGSVTRFALIAVAATLPATLLAPFAGALVDRWDRRRAMIFADSGAAAATLVLVALLATGRLEIWHVYAIVAVGAAFSTFQFPAFNAAISLLVPREQLGRASGMVQLGESVGQVAAPMLAGLLMAAVALTGIVAIDLATFVFAVVMLLVSQVPKLPPRPAEPGEKPSLWREAAYGWHWVRRRSGLMALLALFAVLNLLIPFGFLLVTPMMLSFTGPAELGLALGLGNVGLIVGGVAMSAWGGPKRKILGVVGFLPVMALGLILTGLRPSLPLISLGLFLAFFTVPLTNGSSQAIWLAKVAPEVQGRVFAIRRMIAQFTAPIAFLVAGPLGDRVFKPLLAPGGALTDALGPVFGVGPGRGIGFFYAVLGVLLLLLTAVAFATPRLMRLEEELPDAVPDEPPAGGPPEAAPEATADQEAADQAAASGARAEAPGAG